MYGERRAGATRVQLVCGVGEPPLAPLVAEAARRVAERWGVELSVHPLPPGGPGDPAGRRAGAALELLGQADLALVSMINTDAEARHLAELLARSQPRVCLVLFSQPEVAACLRLPGPDPGRLLRQAEAYWRDASPENVESLLLLLAGALRTLRPELPEPPEPTPPRRHPEVALWYPGAGLFPGRAELEAWRSRARPDLAGAPRVGLVLFRPYVLAGDTAHYEAVVAALERAGLAPVPGFACLDPEPLLREMFPGGAGGVELLINLGGFNLAGSMGRPRPETAAALLGRAGVPCLQALPLLFQSLEGWERDPAGLAPVQAALQVAIGELEGQVEPRVTSGRGPTGRQVPDAAGVSRLAGRAARWVELRRTPPAGRRVAVTLFRFPPDQGAVGTAAYLDVFRSLFHILRHLREAGYTVDLPASPEELRRLFTGAELPVAARLTPADYRRLVPHWPAIATRFGEPPGLLETDGYHLLVRGHAFGNVFVGVQPGFGYEGDPMRLLFAPDLTPSHAFAAYYAWLREVYRPHVLLHLGTHGVLEFMPGKQVGLSAACWPSRLLGDLPHVYLYAVNNPAEGTIARRRGDAVLVSYLSPPLARAGLGPQLADVREALARYRAARGEARAEHFAVLRAMARAAGLDAEVPPPAAEAERSEGLDQDEQDRYADALGAYLAGLAARPIPVGLHVVGERPGRAALLDILALELAHPRPGGGPSLQDAVAAAAAGGTGPAPSGGLPLSPAAAPGAVPAAPPEELVQRVLEGLLAGIEEGCTEAELLQRVGKVLQSAPGAAGFGPLPPLPGDMWQPLVQRVRRVVATLCDTRAELDGLLGALGGRFVAPSPGGDPIRQPAVLPTGRNLHALDPERVPSRVAREWGRRRADALVARFVADHGRYPRAVGLVLWGTDNIKTAGEGIAQALHLLGVEAEEDSLGRPCRLRLIPLEELGRPRIDVVMVLSGIFRDLFPSAADLLDRAVRLVAAAPEPAEANPVRARCEALAGRAGLGEAEAACRLFTNPPGLYGTGVNHLVESAAWERQDDLAALFLARKGQAHRGPGGETGRRLLEALLAGVDLTYQNLDSTEISLADVDHYYEYLGGLTVAAARARGGRRPAAYVGEPSAPGPPRPGGEGIASLEEGLRVESRTRLLNPRWWRGMLRHGYQGVAEIAARLDNTFGWAATTGAVDGWIFDQAADTLLLDDPVRAELAAQNPRAVQRMVGRLLEAADRGLWAAGEQRRARLEALYRELEERVEASAEAVRQLHG